MNTNPILGFLRTLLLFGGLHVLFLKEDGNKQIIMEDGMKFRVFRHVKIRTKRSAEPEAVFVVRFRPQHMTVSENIRFSLLPMMIFMGFHGFCENIGASTMRRVCARESMLGRRWQMLKIIRDQSP